VRRVANAEQQTVVVLRESRLEKHPEAVRHVANRLRLLNLRTTLHQRILSTERFAYVGLFQNRKDLTDLPPTVVPARGGRRPSLEGVLARGAPTPPRVGWPVGWPESSRPILHGSVCRPARHCVPRHARDGPASGRPRGGPASGTLLASFVAGRTAGTVGIQPRVGWDSNPV